MSPQSHYEMPPFRQHGTGAAIHVHRLAIGNSARRLLTARIARAVITLTVCLAVATAAAVTGGPASSHVTRASQMTREIHAFEAKGYAPIACTRKGTLMRNSHTGRLVTAKW